MTYDIEEPSRLNVALHLRHHQTPFRKSLSRGFYKLLLDYASRIYKLGPIFFRTSIYKPPSQPYTFQNMAKRSTRKVAKEEKCKALVVEHEKILLKRQQRGRAMMAMEDKLRAREAELNERILAEASGNRRLRKRGDGERCRVRL